MIKGHRQLTKPMFCPSCQSTSINKNGLKRGKQNHICSDGRGPFIDVYSDRGYPLDVKKQCLHLHLYLEGNGCRRIERLTGVSHNTFINWVKKAGNHLTPEPDYSEIPEIALIDGLQTYAGKKNKFWLWTVVNKAIAGIIAWVVGDRSADTFKALWQVISRFMDYTGVTIVTPFQFKPQIF
ncbi:MAG TPA: IS1 family transposase [Phormidium sp.]